MQPENFSLSQLVSWSAFFKRVVMANGNKLEYPYKYFFVVTKKCGSRCMYCKIWKETAADELSLNEYRRIAGNIGSKMSWLNITGGEPTDRDDLVDIVRVFKEQCPRLLFVNFTSNGLHPERLQSMAKEIVSMGFGKVVINVSLDGPPEANDKIRGVDGSFNKAIHSFLLLKKVKGLKTKLALTLYPQNVDLIEATYQSAKNVYPALKRSDLHLNIPHQSEHYYGNMQVKINAGEYSEKLVSAIKNFRRSAGLAGLLSATNLMEYFYQKKVSGYFADKKSPLDCQALQSSIYISEKGEAYPCTIWNKPLGKLSDYNNDILQLTNSQQYKETREQIIKKNCPNCWTPCEAFTSILGNLSQAVK